MSEEYDRIKKFFSLDPKEKEAHLHEVFEDSFEYFERFKHIMLHGTPDEKKEAAENVMAMKKLIDEETQKISKKTGLSEEELSEISNDPGNFSSSQWEAIQAAKQKIDKGVQEIEKEVRPNSNVREERKKKPKKPKGWIPS